MSEFSPFWAETRDMALATTSAGPEMKKSRQKDDAFLRRVSHFCPQCGQFQEVLFDAF